MKWWHELMQKYSPAAVMQLCGLKKVRNVINRYLELISRLFQKIVGMSRLFSNNLSCQRDKNNLWPISEETSCVCSFNETLAFALTLKMIKAANPRAKATSLKTVTNAGQVLRVDLVKGNRKNVHFVKCDQLWKWSQKVFWMFSALNKSYRHRMRESRACTGWVSAFNNSEKRNIEFVSCPLFGKELDSDMIDPRVSNNLQDKSFLTNSSKIWPCQTYQFSTNHWV